MTDLLTPTEVASLLRVSRATLDRLVSRGAIPHGRLGPRIVRFDRTTIERWCGETFGEKFGVPGGENNGPNKKQTGGSLVVPHNGQRQTMDPDNGRTRPPAGGSPGKRTRGSRSVAEKTAAKIVNGRERHLTMPARRAKEASGADVQGNRPKVE